MPAARRRRKRPSLRAPSHWDAWNAGFTPDPPADTTMADYGVVYEPQADGSYKAVGSAQAEKVEPTSDPNIVRVRASADAPAPEWAMATSADEETGGVIYYGATDEALRAGKVVAAMQTLAEIPERVYEVIESGARAVRDYWPVVPLVLVVAALWWLSNKGR